jgi:biopolymer transport protein TolR
VVEPATLLPAPSKIAASNQQRPCQPAAKAAKQTRPQQQPTMRRQSNRHQLRLITEISITPLLDLVLVLLFVFMLAAPLMKDGGTILLPSSSASPVPNGPREVVTLAMDKTQSLTLDGRSIAMNDLGSALATLAKAKPQVGVQLNLYRDLPVQQLLGLMDTVRVAGITKTAIATIKNTEP